MECQNPVKGMDGKHVCEILMEMETTAVAGGYTARSGSARAARLLPHLPLTHERAEVFSTHLAGTRPGS